MSTNNAGSGENVTIERMRQWQARALAGRIREREMSGKDYIKHAGQQESSVNPMKTLEQDYTDKKEKWDETSMGLLLIPIIGWLIMADRYGDYKQSERAWGTKVTSERQKDEDFVKNFQEDFKKMSQADRNQLCQIGEQFCDEKGFNIKKFIEDSKELSTDEQVVQLENRIKEMNSQITEYQNELKKRADANLILQNRQQNAQCTVDLGRDKMLIDAINAARGGNKIIDLSKNENQQIAIKVASVPEGQQFKFTTNIDNNTVTAVKKGNQLQIY